MKFQTAVLVFHISAGIAAVVVGPIAMLSRKRRGRHTRAGELYHWIMLTVCLSAVLVAILEWQRLWGFPYIALGSYALTFTGYLAAKRRWNGWLYAHVSAVSGSYVAIVTASLVVNWEKITGVPGITSPWAWSLPTVVGSIIIAWVNHQIRTGKRPKR